MEEMNIHLGCRLVKCEKRLKKSLRRTARGGLHSGSPDHGILIFKSSKDPVGRLIPLNKGLGEKSLSMHPHDSLRVDRGGGEICVLQRPKSPQGSIGISQPQPILTRQPGPQFANRFHNRTPLKLIQRQGPARQLPGTEFPQELLDRQFPQVAPGAVPRSGRANIAARIGSSVGDLPDPATMAITPRVSERNLVVANDLIVEIRHVESPVRTRLQIDRPKPGIAGNQEVRLLARPETRAVAYQGVAIDAAGRDVTSESTVGVELAEGRRGAQHYPANRRRAVVVIHYRGHEPETIVRSAKGLVVAILDKQGERFRMTIRAEKITETIKGEPEGVDLAIGKSLHSRTVEAHAKHIAGTQTNPVPVSPGDLGDVVEPVAGVEPAVETPGEGIAHAVGVALVTEWAVELLSQVGPAITVGIPKVPDVGDTEADHSISVGIEPHRYVQAIGEGCHLVRTTIGVGILKNPDRIPPLLFQPNRVGILQSVADPETPAGIEGEIQRLVNLRLAGEELDLEALRQSEAGEFLSGSLRISRTYMVRKEMRSGSMRHFPAPLRASLAVLLRGNLTSLVQHQVGAHLAAHHDVGQAVTADIANHQLGTHAGTIINQPGFEADTRRRANGLEPVENRQLLRTCISTRMGPEPLARNDIQDPIPIDIHKSHRMHLRYAETVGTVSRLARDD